ncbi:PEP-CTERM sorting domain-containing protein [Rhodoferax sp.]|uniref:PEP-CTERM sorting domain-containing protein n=1 Tax=Rhodoferax sp. TaxID=50421 RepID=UPI00283E76FC|nr:PEP-CTERM sorting domain-containing protein [Rhodoferax sp.]MDR3367814.1 PEP-CTERM sorting domain-containing protein [Rhodoferax sp.]
MSSLSFTTSSAQFASACNAQAHRSAALQGGTAFGSRRFEPRALVSALALAAVLPLSVGSALAGPFSITGAITSGQTLGSGSGQGGTVSDTGSLTVSGGTVAVTITGNNATLTNLGTISQTGTGRVIRDNTGVSGLTITNGSVTNATASMTAADADVIQMNKSPASVTLNNYGVMTSLNASAGGAQVVDFNAITAGSNVVNNYATGVMQASEADAVRPGVNGVVNNYGTIKSTTSTGSSSDGIDAQTNSGVQITNGVINGNTFDANALISGGRHGITGGNTDATVNGGAYTMSVTNSGTIQGNNGSGINIDGVNGKEVVTIVNHGTITGNGVTADGDGVDVDGLVNITNTGTIRSLNSNNDTSEGVTVGGGTIVNSGTIQGSIGTPAGNTGTGRGITIAGVDKDANGNPIAIQAPYGPTTITNSGLIKGDSDSGIAFTSALASGYATTITNQAGGTIEGGGTAVALKTGADNDTVYNLGIIKADSSGKAINLGAGNNALYIQGGAAQVIGDIDGGKGGTNTMTVEAGAGNRFDYAGMISDFKSVAVTSGTLALHGANRVASDVALDLDGGTLQLLDAGGADGQTFASLDLLDNSVIDLGLSSITFDALGSIIADKTLSVLNYAFDISPSYAFRFLGNLSGDANFLALMSGTTINGQAVKYSFDGMYTDVSSVPEPATLAMLLQGLGLMGFMAIRRKKTSV